MSRFFIARPVFSCVLAILIMLAGGLSLVSMPVSQFPHMAPPTISLQVEYSGASAQTIQDSIAQVIEQQMVGLDNLLFMSTTSSSEGRMRMGLTFEATVTPDMAQMQVQNRLQLAMPRLPDTVKSQGVRVRKVSDTFLQYYSFYSKDGSIPIEDIGDFVSSTLMDALSRVDGVGDATLYGAPYSMRIWIDPNKLRSFSLVPDDVVKAVALQNEQIAVGQIGGLPTGSETAYNVTILSRSKLNTIGQFEDIVVRARPDGSCVRVRDVARVEMGRSSYSIDARYNANPACSVGIQLAEGANAIETSARVAAFMERMKPYLPTSVEYTIPYDTVPFIQESIRSVSHTLVEAVILVSVIMFLFLQNWRATLIPTLAVPIVLLGTMAVMRAYGTSVNTLSMFGLVLAIGLLVDDAIVVVENTERIMRTEHLPPREAIRKSMDQITGALIGIAAVLSAVFLPMAFFSGMTGAIYREFSITIVSAMVLSVFVAITITPPLCGILLKADYEPATKGPFGWFNRMLDANISRYGAGVEKWIRHPWIVMGVYAVLAVATVFLMRSMPTSFLPVEDQGVVNMNIIMPAGSTRPMTAEIAREVERYFLEEEKDAVRGINLILGIGPNSARGQSVAGGLVNLKPWAERRDPRLTADAVVARARARFASHPKARLLFFQPPQVRGLGNSSGITMQLEDQGGLGHEALAEARTELLAKARKSPLLYNVRTNSLDNVPQFRLEIDDLKAGVYGVSAEDINDNLEAAWGGKYVNDFVDRGRVKRVYVQGDAPYRTNADDIRFWFLRNRSGDMVPLTSFVRGEWSFGPTQLERFNGVPSTVIDASPAPGVSSGDAMNELVRLVGELPHGIGYEWSGMSFEEGRAGTHTGFLYALSILVVFLCLAALYESWTIPFAVILVVPIGVLGALGLSSLRGLYNDVYFQVGILAVIGLSSKNAILIVEFARNLVREGYGLLEAASTAAAMRIRPIVMTSLAFLLGVFPLCVSRGAGANSQHDIGTGIVGGTILATAVGIYFIPVFFVVVSRIFGLDRKKDPDGKDEAAPADASTRAQGGREAR